MLRKRIVWVAPLLLAVACLGCGEDGPPIATVKGQVKMDGKPLPNATVVYSLTSGEGGRPAAGRTDEEGNYELNFTQGRQGAIPGEYMVRIYTLSDPMQNEDGTMTKGSPETVPTKYNALTELKATVEAGKENVIDFVDLTTEGGQIRAKEAGDS